MPFKKSLVVILQLFFLVFFMSECDYKNVESRDFEIKDFIYFNSFSSNSDLELIIFSDSLQKQIGSYHVSSIGYFDVAYDSSFIVYNQLKVNSINEIQDNKLLFKEKGGRINTIDSNGFSARISPLNEKVVYRSANNLKIYDVKTQSASLLLRGFESTDSSIYFKSPTWSANGKFVYFTEISRAKEIITTVKRINLSSNEVESIANIEHLRTIRASPVKNDEIYAFVQRKDTSGIKEIIIRLMKDSANAWNNSEIIKNGSDMFDVSPNGKKIIYLRDSLINDSTICSHLFVFDMVKGTDKQVTFGKNKANWLIWKKL